MFQSEQLDLSRFPAPLAIRDLGAVQILDERLVRLSEELAKIGVSFDTNDLASDALVVLQDGDTWRELIARTEINDAVRSVMIAFSVGADLDHLAAFYGVVRLTGEQDPQFRRRVLLAPEAFSTAGSEGAYRFHALSASVDVVNVDVWKSGPGQVRVAIQSAGPRGIAEQPLIELVRDHLHQKDIKPLTDMVSVSSVKSFDYSIDVEGFVLPGPDPLAVKKLMEDSLFKMAIARFTPTRDVPLSAIYAAATVGPVDRVVIKTPLADIARGDGELANCTGIKVKVQTHDG